MAYEQRFKLAKIAATIILIVNATSNLAGAKFPHDSAMRAILIFSMLVLALGLVLCWSRLHGTGRGVRMAMFLVIGTTITALYTVGASVYAGGIFVAALLTIIATINRNPKNDISP